MLSFQRPHHPVAKATITRWLCDVLVTAGIDSTIFKAHSTRAASTSAAAKKHLPLDILKMGDWTSSSSFHDSIINQLLMIHMQKQFSHTDKLIFTSNGVSIFEIKIYF